MGNTFMFQQDNDPKHTEAITYEWLFNFSRLQAPFQSSDLNIIEMLWHYFDFQIQKQKITGKKRLQVMLQGEWHKMHINVIKNLVYSMPRRAGSHYRSKWVQYKIIIMYCCINLFFKYCNSIYFVITECFVLMNTF